MKIDYRKRFLKELSKIPTEIRSSIESFVFKELPKANSIFELDILCFFWKQRIKINPNNPVYPV